MPRCNGPDFYQIVRNKSGASARGINYIQKIN